MQRRFWDNVDLIEWKAARIFAFLRDDCRGGALERRYLPVDVPHLRFQKRTAITGDNLLSCHVARSRDISHCYFLKIRDSPVRSESQKSSGCAHAPLNFIRRLRFEFIKTQ